MERLQLKFGSAMRESSPSAGDRKGRGRGSMWPWFCVAASDGDRVKAWVTGGGDEEERG